MKHKLYMIQFSISEIHSRSLLRISFWISVLVLIGQYKMNLLLKSDFFSTM